MPPKPSKHEEVRYFDIREDDDLDDLTEQLESWVEQAGALPSVRM